MPTLPSKDSPTQKAATAPRPPASKRGHVQQFDQDRTCSEPGCTTTLSRYNALPTCGVHGEQNGRPH